MNNLAPIAQDSTVLEAGPALRSGRLRILATTDLHMHLTAYDYVADKPTQNPGLAGIATLIGKAREEAAAQDAACLLFDNGDLLQGTAMGEWLSRQPVTSQHPAVACLNDLKYDAIGVGNHDLDYGMPYLRDVAAHLTPPMIASNMSAADLGSLTPAALIPCTLPASSEGPEQVVQVGVLSVLPHQTALWNHHHLKGVATINAAKKCLSAAIPALRARGADLVVVLAHMGLEGNTASDDTALPLAHLPGIDAMITGHTHRRFPGGDHSGAKGVNTLNSTVAEVPTVMPGHAGSDLAVLDLTLRQNPDKSWQVAHHKSALRRNKTDTRPAPSVLAATSRVEHKLRGHLATKASQTARDLQNYFALAAPTETCALIANAKAFIARVGLAGKPEAELPLLASSSAHTAGGRDGPRNFLHIPKGPVLRRHLWGLNPYANRVWVVRVTGSDLKEKLEHAAGVYNHLHPDTPEQPLRHPRRPMFDFDTIFGLNYVIDPGQPLGQRISELTHNAQPVLPEQQFLLATNQFRVAGGGGYTALPADRVVLRSNIALEDGLTSALAASRHRRWAPRPWTLKSKAPLGATLFTSPRARPFLDEIDHLSPQVDGQNPDGFLQLRLTL